jgi:hypothetical protein
MKFALIILGLLCCSHSILCAQSKIETLGDPTAIVLDLEIDEEKKQLLLQLREMFKNGTMKINNY